MMSLPAPPTEGTPSYGPSSGSGEGGKKKKEMEESAKKKKKC